MKKMTMKFVKNKFISRRKFLKSATFVGVGSAVSGVSTFQYGHYIEPRWLEIKYITVKLTNLPEAFKGMKIVLISDFHADESITPKEIAKVVTLINLLKPNLVAITGDYITRDSSYALPVAETLSRINVPLGCFAILGNHDYWGNVNEIINAFDLYSLPLLRNQSQPIIQNGSRIWIAGIDDILEGQHDLEKTLAGIPPDETTILLAHEPDYADIVATTGAVDLQLSGHSHGGQVRIPFYGAPILPPLGRKYPWGLTQVEQMQVYTNRGIGVSSAGRLIPPVRVNCRPEITLLTLTNK